MKREVSMFALTFAVLTLASLNAVAIMNAEAADSYYSIDRVDHTIRVLYNGYISINDTVEIEGTAPDGFLVGLPYEYGPQILRCTAYNATSVFSVSSNIPLENRIGFYGVRINFGQSTPQTFNVVFVLAPYNISRYTRDLLVQDVYNATHFTLNFPAYPSLTRTVANCSASIHLPEGSTFISGSVDGFTYSQENLHAFTSLHANVTFSSTEEQIQIIDFDELKREIRIDGVGNIEASDTYHIKSKALHEISSVDVVLPRNASGSTAHNLLGRELGVDVNEEASRLKVTLTAPLETEESAVFTVAYHLPCESYIDEKEAKSFNLMFPLFYDLGYYVQSYSVIFILPEGAEILSFQDASTTGSYSLSEDVFQETLTISRQGVFSLDSFDVRITYKYDLLWSSFRPTLWMWALAIVGCLVAAMWKKPAAPIQAAVPEVAVKIRSKDIKSFVDAYERKRKILLEIESLTARAGKGKIPRRRYKVRRKTLETRLNALSRNLTDLQGKLQAAGGIYRDLMRRLEVAETEMNEVEANIESIETRHRRGDLSLGAYRKLRSDYEQRRDKAAANVNEILIRLREKIR